MLAHLNFETCQQKTRNSKILLACTRKYLHPLTAHQPTKNQAVLPSWSTDPLASGVQKKSLPGAGGVFLTRGEQEIKAQARGEATAHQEVETGALRGRGGATGDER